MRTEVDMHPSGGLHVGLEYGVYSLYKLFELDTNPSALFVVKRLRVRTRISKRNILITLFRDRLLFMEMILILI
jgi:hypothetical protein